MIDRGLRFMVKKRILCNDFFDYCFEINEIFVFFDMFIGENCCVYVGKCI